MAPPVVAAAAAPSMMQTIAPSLIGGALGMFGSSSQNRANQAASAKQMEFQERMSSSAYQRGMADMKKAGLNPILAYSKGGATTPSGSTYQAQNIGSAAVTGAQQSSQAAQTGAQTTLLKSDQDFANLTGLRPQDAPSEIKKAYAYVNSAKSLGMPVDDYWKKLLSSASSGVKDIKTSFDNYQDRRKFRKQNKAPQSKVRVTKTLKLPTKTQRTSKINKMFESNYNYINRGR